MIELRDVSFSYAGNKEGIRNIDLCLQDNECVVLTGCSGSGKTTLTRLLSGLAPGYYPGTLTGDIRIDGKPVQDLPQWERARRVGSVFQNPKSQFFSSELAGEIAFAAENFGLPGSEVRARTDALIREMGLWSRRNVPIDLFSSGEKQKTALASVCVYAPGIYVFDEPSANLDRDATAQLAMSMAELKARGATLIVAEHRLYHLMEIADRFLHLKDGVLMKSYTKNELLALTDVERTEMGLRSPFDTPCPKLPTPIVMGENMPSVSLENVSCKVKRTPILNSVSFVAFPGQIIAVTGRNGIGKTTLAKIMCGLIRETAGYMQFGGDRVRASKRRRYVWYSANDTNTQFFTESVTQELTLSAREAIDAKDRVSEVLETFSLYECKQRHPVTLSGGEKQRLSLACGILSGRDILILDEPTSGLDARNMLSVSETLKHAAARGKTVLIVTHDHELVRECCTHIYHVGEKESSLRGHHDEAMRSID
jgi:energy-coupling factor transport system ATP-binding protein